MDTCARVAPPPLFRRGQRLRRSAFRTASRQAARLLGTAKLAQEAQIMEGAQIMHGAQIVHGAPARPAPHDPGR